MPAPAKQAPPSFELRGDHAVVAMVTAVVTAVLVLCAVRGCSSSATDDARVRGAAAGRIDGQRAAETDAFREAEDAAYVGTLSELSLSGLVRRSPLYCLAAILVGLLAGFIIQYVIFYLLRRPGFISDVDSIVLSPATVNSMRNASAERPRIVLAEQPMKFRSPNQDA